MASNNNGARVRKQTLKGQAYTMETLQKEVKKLMGKLSNQISLFDDLLNTRNVTMVQTELSRLESIFGTMKLAAERLLEITTGREKEQVEEMISAAQEKFMEVENRVEKWLNAQERRSIPSKSSRTPEIKSNMQLTVDLMMIQSRLENQMGKVDNLLESSDIRMISSELARLEAINKEMKETSNILGEGVLDDERIKVADIVQRADEKVNEIKSHVDKQMNGNNVYVERISQHSQQREHSFCSNPSKGSTRFDSREDMTQAMQTENRDIHTELDLSLPVSEKGDHVEKKELNVGNGDDNNALENVWSNDNETKVASGRRSLEKDEIGEGQSGKLMVRNDVEISQDSFQGIPKEKERDGGNDKDIMPPPANVKMRREEDSRSFRSGRSGQSWKSVHCKGLGMGVGGNNDFKKAWSLPTPNKRSEQAKKPSSNKSSGSKQSLLSSKSRLLKKVVKDYGESHNQEWSSVPLEKAHSSERLGEKTHKSSHVGGGIVEGGGDCLTKLRLKFENQNELIRALLRTSNDKMMSKEMENLDKIYEEMLMAGEALLQGESTDKEEEISDQMSKIDAAMVETKRQVVKWMTVQARREERSTLSGCSRKSFKSKFSHSMNSSSTRKLQGNNKKPVLDHIRRLQGRLEDQRSLIQGSLKANDVEMTTREIDVLEQLHGNLVAAAGKILNIELDTDVEVENVLMEEEAKLFDLKRQFVTWMVEHAEADARSQVSNSTRQTGMSDYSNCPRGRHGKEETETQRKEHLWEKLVKLRTRLDTKKNLCKELLSTTKDINMLRQNFQILEETYSEAAEIAFSLRELLPGMEAKKIMEKVEQEDAEIHQIKRSMVKLMASGNNSENLDAVDKAPISERDDKECQLVYDRNKPIDGEGMIETVGLQEDDFAVTFSREHVNEQLREEVRRIGARLGNQQSLVRDLLKSTDSDMMNREVMNLDKVYDDYVAAASHLRTLLPLEAKSVSAWIDAEDANVFQVKQLVSKWMVSKVVTSKSETSDSTGHLHELHSQEVRGMELPLDVDTLKRDRQKGWRKESKQNMKGVEFGRHQREELLRGDGSTSEYPVGFSGGGEFALTTQEKKIDKLLANVESLMKVRETKMYEDTDCRKKVSGHKEKEVKFGDNQTLNRSCVSGSTSICKETEIAELRGELAALKGEQQTNQGVPERGQNKGIKGIVQNRNLENEVSKADGLQANDASQQAEGDARTSSLLKLNELMVQTLKLQAAPKAEIDSFSGDPMEYNYFVENFRDVVENMIDDPRQRLVRLLKYTCGDAKELIKHCVHEQADTCYDTALGLLEKEYGSPFRIASAYLEKLKAWPQIKANDPGGLRELYRFLIRCASYQRKGIIDLNSPLTIRSIQLALPAGLQDKWTGRAGKIRKKKNAEASFADFLEYVEEESNVLNDPVYARNGLKDKSKQDGILKTCSTDVVEGDKKKLGLVCHFCRKEHDLDDCTDFKEKNPREKKDFLFKSKLCFSCYGKGHLVKDCTTKRTCETCGEGHPTGLHGVRFKVSAVHQGDVEGAMCIVPVRLSHASHPEEETEVYAMLDECSTGTFVCETLAEKWTEKRKTNISVETVAGVTRMETYAINGLVVRGVKEFQDKYGAPQVKLPTTYTQETLPMDKEDIPDVTNIARWEYLKEVVSSIPEVKDIPLGLLIGRNCPKALEPLQVISSREEGPYAKRSRLGWCVVGPSVDKERVGMKCNRIKVCTSAKDVTYESPRIPQVVLRTKISDNTIADALQEMYRTDFIEREGEKNGLSKEDRVFLDMMKNNICFSKGHYTLPLPLRMEEVDSYMVDEQIAGAVGGRMANVTAVDPHQAVPILLPEEIRKVGVNTHVEPRATRKMKAVVMPDNRNLALHRLRHVKRRMLKDEGFREEYVNFMKKLFIAGYARRVVSERKLERAWYLPHHGVYHPTKGKIRIVFDCSAEKEGISLNSKLIQGPDFTNSLIGVLLRFRKGLIPFTADIEAMYYQVRLPEEHWKYLRFLWWDGDDCRNSVVECEMQVHPFGAVSSKNCVTFALHQTAFDNKEKFGKDAMETLLLDFYVDDWLKSLDDEKAVIDLIRNTEAMCAAGGFNLTKFVCANPAVIDSIPIEKRAETLKGDQITTQRPDESALGLLWQIGGDTLGFRVSFTKDDGTRLGCLATISKVHDPCGIVAPFLLKGRKVLQRMTAESVDWHQTLPENEAVEWGDWREDVLLLNELNIQRCYRSKELGRIVNTSLHCFSDASFIGYGVACYLRMVDEAGKVEVSLVMGKSRVSPLKPTTVPRLELTAAVVAVKLAALLIEELKIPELETYYWIDSKIVLGYICNRTRRYRVFVANRVQLIEEYTKGRNFRYVATKENPADLASRGISPRDRKGVEKWLKGAEFLRQQDEKWRTESPEVEIVEDDVEVKVEKKANAIVVQQRSVLESLELRISSWHRMKRVMAWIRRFGSRCRGTQGGIEREGANSSLSVRSGPTDGQAQSTSSDDLSVQELEAAERAIIKMMQERDLGDELKELKKEKGRKRKGKLWRLSPFVDEWGILRVGGRLANASEDDSFKFPVIIPKRTTCTKRLIEWHHSKIEHRGKHATVGRLREFGFWVINGSKETGSVVFRCVRCKWLRGRCGEQKMADLPANRITVEPPFTCCGVDVFGALLAKQGRKTVKRYAVLFTCFSLRAVHIEVASSLETDSFIQALRRFIARRGAVRELRSDNGTNFVGADNELKKAMLELDQDKISAFLSEQGCDWIRFERNTPKASHMGGVWERQIRTVKGVLSSLVKSSPRVLDEETLRTFLAEAEAIVNSRPLTIENLHDPCSSPLTPNQILTMKSRLVLPPPGVFQEADLYCRKRWRVAQHLANCFWTRWRKEYLQGLQARQKWTEVKRNLQVDDVVLLKEEGVVRGHWPMARVAEVHQSEDGLVRSVSVQVGRQILKRPVNKTVLLVATSN